MVSLGRHPGPAATREIQSFALDFAYLGCAAVTVFACQFVLFTVGSERGLFRLRREFMRVLLCQDVGWVDGQRQGDIAERLAEYVAAT